MDTLVRDYLNTIHLRNDIHPNPDVISNKAHQKEIENTPDTQNLALN